MFVAAALGLAVAGASFGAVSDAHVVWEINLSEGDRYDTVTASAGG